MPILSVVELPNRSTSFGQGYQRRRKRTFRVITDSDYVSEDEVLFNLGLDYGDQYVNFGTGLIDPLCVLVDFDASPLDDDPRLWIVTCNYETQSAAPQATPTQNQQPGGGGDADDPTQWEPKITRSYGRIQWPMERGFDDDNELTIPVVNSAGDEFNPKPMMDVRYLIITHERIEAEYDIDAHANFGGAVNLIVWNGFVSERVLLDDWTVDDEYIGQTLFYRHRRVFHIAPPVLGTWKLFLLDAGFVDLLGNAIVAPNSKSPVTTPWPLADTGFPLTRTQIEAREHGWLDFRKCQRLDFDDLNITL